MPGAEGNWKPQESVWCPVFLSPFSIFLPSFPIYPEILLLGHHVSVVGFSRPEKVR